MIKRQLQTSMILALAMSSPLTLADVVQLPDSEQSSSWSGETPERGASKAWVIEKFGEPSSTHGPTGEPPIYFWEYSDFTVYFESDHVVHTVVKKRD